MTYYIFKNREKTGPYTREQILAMFDADLVDSDTSIMHKNLSRWFRLADIKHEFTSGTDEEFFRPALFDNAPLPPEIIPGIVTSKVLISVPKTRREEIIEDEKISQYYKMIQGRQGNKWWEYLVVIIFAALVILAISYFIP